MTMPGERRDYFVSYNNADLAMAVWVGQQVEQQGHSVILQAWDFAPGTNFVAAMHEALQRCERLMLILSRAYLAARYTNEEWQAAYALGRRLLPVRIDDCRPPGLLAPIVYVDLHGCDADEAQRRLGDALAPPGRPRAPVPFPGPR